MAGFTVSALTDYTNKATELLRKGILFSDAIMQFSVQTGVKYKEPLNMLAVAPTLQAGACSLSAAGSTVLTEKVITVATMAYRDSYCIEDLQKKNLPLVAGSANDAFAPEFSSVLTDEITDAIKKKTETIIFQGTVSGGDLIDGLIENISGDSATIDIADTTVTAGNVVAELNKLIAATTEAMFSRGQLTIHTSVAIYNMYRTALITSKSAYQVAPELGFMEANIEGWAGVFKIKAETGLSGSNAMICTWDKNIYIGTDEVSEISEAKYVHDEITDLVWYKANFKLGVQTAFGSEIVSNIN